jgi:hypothetical protein
MFRSLRRALKPDYKKIKKTLERLRMDDDHSATDFSTVQAVHRYKKKKDTEKKERRRARSKRKTKKKADFLRELNRPNPEFNFSGNAGFESKPVEAAKTESAPRKAEESATRKADPIKKVPSSTINNPPPAMGLFQDAVIALAAAYSKDKDDRLSKYEELLRNAKLRQIDAETAVAREETNATVFKTTKTTLETIEAELMAREKKHAKEWDELLKKARKLSNDYETTCELKSNKQEFDLLLSLLAKDQLKDDMNDYKLQLARVEAIVMSCSSPNDRYALDQKRIKETLEKLRKIGMDIPECYKEEYTKRLQGHTDILRRLVGAKAVTSNRELLNETLAKALTEYDAVVTDCRNKKKEHDLEKLKKVSPAWKAAKIVGYVALGALAVGTLAVGAKPTYDAATGLLSSAKNAAGTVWDGGLVKLFSDKTANAAALNPQGLALRGTSAKLADAAAAAAAPAAAPAAAAPAAAFDPTVSALNATEAKLAHRAAKLAEYKKGTGANELLLKFQADAAADAAEKSARVAQELTAAANAAAANAAAANATAPVASESLETMNQNGTTEAAAQEAANAAAANAAAANAAEAARVAQANADAAAAAETEARLAQENAAAEAARLQAEAIRKQAAEELAQKLEPARREASEKKAASRAAEEAARAEADANYARRIAEHNAAMQQLESSRAKERQDRLAAITALDDLEKTKPSIPTAYAQQTAELNAQEEEFNKQANKRADRTEKFNDQLKQWDAELAPGKDERRAARKQLGTKGGKRKRARKRTKKMQRIFVSY